MSNSRANSHHSQNTSQNSISTVFGNKIKFLGFHAVVATREDLSIDVAINY